MMTSKSSATAADIIALLNLQPLPHEGGYYSETYKSSTESAVPKEFEGDVRKHSTAIHYLITPESFSALHKLKQDEVFHFYSGEPAEMLQIFPDGSHKIITIGSDILKGERPQVLVPAGVWQATRLKRGGHYALMGTTCAPGFEFRDFTLGDSAALIRQFPDLQNVITQFTPEGRL